MAVPYAVEPMLLLARRQLPPDEDCWAYEIKYDGYRAVIHAGGDRVRVQSRQLRDLTGHYPVLQALADVVPAGTVLDGELVALTADGGHDFEMMRSRAGRVHFQAFDILYLAGRNVMGRPYVDRRRQLEDLGLAGPHWSTPAVSIGGEVPGPVVLEASRSAGLEGLVVKRLSSPYESGGRSGAWVKVKNWVTSTFRVGGWRRDSDGAGGWLGGLLVGQPTAEGLEYAGVVELGLQRAVGVLEEAVPMLRCEGSPFGWERAPRRVEYLRPVLEVEVRHIAMKGNGLRFGVLVGLRVAEQDRLSMRT